jgi:molybdenum-dependent DNA-binding transcriptional regulator ModE
MSPDTNSPQRLIFLHSKLDEARLDPYEFRLLAHIARREKCYASLATTAKWCEMSVRKAQSSLKKLVEMELVLKIESNKRGQTHTYMLADDLLKKLESQPFLQYKWKKEQKFKEKQKKKGLSAESGMGKGDGDD